MMSDTLTADPTAEETRKAEAVLTEIFTQVERIDERITKDQQETEQLRAQTRRMLAELKVR